MSRHSLIGFTVLALTTAILLGPSARADYKQATAHYQQGKYTQAINDLKEDMDKNPDYEYGHRIIGLSYLGLGNASLAERELSRAAELKSPAYSTYFGLGQANFSLKKFEKCISALDKAEPLAAKEANADKLKADLYALRGKSYYETKKYNEAVNDLKKAIGVNQSDWMAHYVLGDACSKLNRLDEAIQYLEKAHSLKSDNNSITESLGKVYRKQGTDALSGAQYDLAIKALLKAKDYIPKDGFVFYNLAEVYRLQKNYPDAEKALTQAATLMPKNLEVFEHLGLVCENLKKWDLALDAYKKADEISPATERIKKAIERVNENKKLDQPTEPKSKPTEPKSKKK
jgi:tetratricopeptide (TPR) repeat protein